MIQNDKANFSHLISVLEADSVSELKKDIKLYEKQRDEALNQQQQANLEANQKLAEFNRETQLLLKDKDFEREIEKAKIDVFKFQQDLDTNNNGVPDPLEISKLEHTIKKDNKQLQIKEKELALKKEELSLKSRQINTKKK